MESSDQFGKFTYLKANMNPAPIVSVLMSVYKSEKTLIKALDSIINQTQKEIELLIIDDASTDESLSILEEYRSSDKRITLIKNAQNIGLTKSLIRGVPLCQGKYIARQDADDFSELNRIEVQLDLIHSKNCELVFSRYEDGNNTLPNLSLLGPFRPEKLKYANIFAHGTMFISKELLKKINYDPSWTYAQDYELYMRLFKHKICWAMANECLYHLGQGEGQISRRKSEAQNSFAMKACLKHFGTDKYFIAQYSRPVRAALKGLRLIGV